METKKTHKSLNDVIQVYKNRLSAIETACLNDVNTEADFRLLFKEATIEFIKCMDSIYKNKIKNIPNLNIVNIDSKINNLHMLLDCLENGDGKMFGLDCNDIILRGYINYFYSKYREKMLNWDIEYIKVIDETYITDVVVDTAQKENVSNSISEHLNMVPEVVLMMNNLKDKDIMKLLYHLNELNTIIDVFLSKKMSKQI